MRESKQRVRHFGKLGGSAAACIAALLFGEGALAQAAAPDGGAAREVVVTATRIPTDIEDVGSSVTVITGADIERKQQRTLVEVLQSVPGLSVTQLGGPGRQASVFSRGTNSNETLVLIDGIEANDPSAPNGAFDFAHLLPENVDRIEIVRGPQSMLYGSQAIGGVINIITKRGGGTPQATARIEGGSDTTGNAASSVAGTIGKVNFSAGVTGYHTDGEPILARKAWSAGAPGTDARYSNMTASTRLGVALGERGEASLVTRYVRALTDLDPNLTGGDPNARDRQNQYFTRLETRGLFFDGFWEPVLGLDYTRYDRAVEDHADAFSTTDSQDSFTGTRYKADLQNNLHVSDAHTVVIGLETRTEALKENVNDDFGGFIVTDGTNENVDSQAVYGLDRFKLSDRFSGSVGIRHDEHQRFGGATTYSATGLYRIVETGTRLKASYGTGYRAPALHELFGHSTDNFGGEFVGNPALKPEQSIGWEGGFDQALYSGRLKFGVTWFQNRITDLVVCGLSTCNNTSIAHTWGFESFVRAELTDRVSLALTETYTRAEDSFGDELKRRPKHRTGATLEYRPVRGARIGLAALLVGPQKDAGIAGGTVYDGSYALFNLSAAYDLDERVTLFARADNLLDREYEVADGFRGLSRTVIGGVRARF